MVEKPARSGSPGTRLAVAEREARRGRTTTRLIRKLFKLDYANLAVEDLAEALIELLVETLKVDRATLLSLDRKRQSFSLVRATGFDAIATELRHDLAPVPQFDFINADSAVGPMAKQVQEFMQAPFLMWAYDDASGFALVLGNLTEDQTDHPRFDDTDRELVESALDVFANIVERKRAEARLIHDAFHDALTGLPNRTLFIKHLDLAMGRAQRTSGYLFSVLFIDVDRFKLVNDSLGHAVGDELLVEVGRRLRAAVRGADVVSRLSGDEFAVLADDLAELGDAVRLADRVIEEMKRPFDLGSQPVFVSVSIGIARNAARYHTGTELLRDADIAMYRAKELGGGAHRMFDSDMHTVMVSRLEVETGLRQALEGDQFRLAYQPIIDLRSGRATAFEALLRWRHPVKGTIAPGDFIPVAEETGLIVPIGRWVLAEACKRIRALNRNSEGPVAVSVNLSDREFLQPGLFNAIKSVLSDTGVPAGCLHLELTERMLLDHEHVESDLLPRLKELGVRVMIDDFGTGYSSLSRLQRLPIDSLKIDHSFVSDLDTNEDSAEIVRTIVALAHNLGIGVVAEGVERPSQLEIVRGLGCEYAQGYLFARPVDERRVAGLLDRDDWLGSSD